MEGNRVKMPGERGASAAGRNGSGDNRVYQGSHSGKQPLPTPSRAVESTPIRGRFFARGLLSLSLG